MMEYVPDSDSNIMTGLHTPDKIWFELHREKDSCDAIVRMDDGTVYTGMFVTIAYLQRQMQLNYEVTQQVQDTPPVSYAAMDTPHIFVQELTHEIIEDTIDNLLALDVFESYFIRVTESPQDDPRTINDGHRATQEVAAVVIEDVLLVED